MATKNAAPSHLPILEHRLNAVQRLRRSNLGWGLLLVSPWILGFLAFTLYPMAASLYYSLTNFDMIQKPHWVGLANYGAMLHDSTFWLSVWNTGYMIIIGVPLSLVFGLGLAVLANQKIRGQGLYRTLFFLPSVVPAVAAALLFLWVLNPQYGMINEVLGFFHIPGPGWLVSMHWAKPGLLLMILWGVGSNMVIFLAGLNGVPTQMYEAARIDGATAWITFWKMTLPNLSGVILYNVVTGVIGMSQIFTQAFVIAGSNGSITLGTPDNATLLYNLYLYEKAFQDLDFGYASAMAWVLTIVTMGLTLAMFVVYDRVIGLEGGTQS